MRASVSLVRRWGVWCACLVSLAVGSVLVWRIVTPDSLDDVMTSELLALVGMFVLPLLAAWSFLAQRREPERPRREASADFSPDEAPAPGR